jgi:hypothetical protein
MSERKIGAWRSVRRMERDIGMIIVVRGKLVWRLSIKDQI